MSATTSETGARSTGDLTDAAPAWLGLQRAAAVVVVVGAAAIHAIAKTIIPPLIVFSALFVIAAIVSRRRPRAGSIALGVLGILMLLGNLPYVISDLSHPDSPLPFITNGVLTIAVLVAFAGGLTTVLRRAGGTRAAVVVALVAVVAFVAVGVGGRLAASSTAAESGDLRVVAKDIEFDPAVVHAPAGQISVHVENEDAIAHTFAIDGLDVDLSLPASTGQRVTFNAPPGTYTIHCTIPGHENMKATLVVDG